jgi:hypothetical protein
MISPVHISENNFNGAKSRYQVRDLKSFDHPGIAVRLQKEGERIFTRYGFVVPSLAI